MNAFLPRLPLLLLALGSAALPARAQETAVVSADIEYADAQVTLTVNGLPAVVFQRQAEPQTLEFLLTLWLEPGDNEVAVTLNPRGFKPSVKVDIRRDKKETLLAAGAWAGRTSGVLRFSVADLPRWAWHRATPQPSGVREVRRAVVDLHRALRNRDYAGIYEYRAAYFEDLSPLFGEISRERHMDLLQERLAGAVVEPLGPAEVTRHREGRLYNVEAADGTPPIVLSFADGRRLVFGRWWSHIDDQWRNVR
jgi:hypothetical protein